MDALLAGLVAEAEESLEPLLGLSAALARDLQDDFLPFFPRLMQRLAQLISTGEQLSALVHCLHFWLITKGELLSASF